MAVAYRGKVKVLSPVELRLRAMAYPKLVDALRNALRSDKFKLIAELEARTLLRELGEIE